MNWVDMVAETKSICSPSYCCWMCNLSAGETPNIIRCWAPNVMLSLKEANKPLSGKLFTLDTLCHGEGSDLLWLGFACISRYGYSFLPAVPQLFCYPRAHRLSDLSTWDLAWHFFEPRDPPYRKGGVAKDKWPWYPILPHTTSSITQKLQPDKTLVSSLIGIAKASALKWYLVSMGLCLSGCSIYLVMVNFMCQFSRPWFQIFCQTLFWIFLWGCFWMRLKFKLVDFE